jgi:hypothetical protein
VYFTVDQDIPEAFWSNLTISGTGPFTYSAILSFSEAVTFDVGSVSLDFDSDCSLVSEELPAGWKFAATCGFGDGSFELAADSLTDRALLTGPSEALSLRISNTKPEVILPTEPEPTPEPEPEPTPVTSGETQTPPATQLQIGPPQQEVELIRPVDTGLVASPEPIPGPSSDAEETIPQRVIDQALELVVESPSRPSVNGSEITPAPVGVKEVIAPDVEPAETATSEPQMSPAEVLAQPVLGEALKEQTAEMIFSPWMAGVLGGLLLLIGLGAWRFSGR